jgi:hypothetical protein
MNGIANQSVNSGRLIKVYISKAQNNFGGELGQSAMRRINIVGTANLVGSTGLEGASGIAAALRRRFASQGWLLSNFDFTGGGLFSDTVNINLTADVPGQYSNQQHLDQAYAILNNYELSSGITKWRPLNRVYLTLTGAEMPNYVPEQTTSISGTQTPQGNGSSLLGNNPFGLPTFGSLFGSSGTSVLLVVGVLAGIIIFKR